jgi:Uma2 family endonuclease
LGKVFFSPIDVYLNDKNVFQPDIIFVSKDRSEIIDWKKGIMGAPDLVIEVLSKGNEKYDLTEKKIVYEVSGVKEYWLLIQQQNGAKASF